MKNLLIAAGIGLVLLIVVSIYLRIYTRHGEEAQVPDVVGMYQEEACAVLGNSGFTMDVIDSTYSSKVPMGTIVEQNPPAASYSKNGRTIYVVVNASCKKKVSLPVLTDLSFRQAENLLHQVGLMVADTIYEPSEYRDLVLDVRLGDESLDPGRKLYEGTAVVLVIGRGQGVEMVPVPDLRGKSITDVRSILLESKLTMGAHIYDVEPTDENRERYIVYWQDPQPGTSLLEGSGVAIWLSTDSEKAATMDKPTNEEDEFF